MKKHLGDNEKKKEAVEDLKEGQGQKLNSSA